MNQAPQVGARALRALAGALLGLCLTAGAAAADDGGAHGCVWGPINDVPAVQGLLDQLAASTNLPPCDKHTWGLSIEHGSAGRLTLPFAKGALTLGWDLDEACEPTAITIEASPDYEGPRPDDAAVKRLVAGLRALTVEQRSGPSQQTYSRLAVAFLLGLGALLSALLWLAGRRWLAARMPLVRVTTPDLIRLLGLVGIVALLPYQPAPPGSAFVGDWLSENSLVLIGILPLTAFLWLAVSGYFGYGSPSREDWPALLPFLLALAIREAYARQGIEGVELHFKWSDAFDRHSVVYTFYVMFLQPLARDPYQMVMHANGIVGAVAALPLYLFSRQRTGNPTAALLISTFYAVHPILVQMAPTDSPYSLCFATWFMGLALLTTAEIGPRQLLGGAILLGIAATCRAEGGLYLPASLLLIDVRALLRAVRLHLGAAVISLGVLLGLLAVEVHFIFAGHLGGGASLPVDDLTVESVLRAALYSIDYNDPVIVVLVIVGAVAGLVNKRLRIGLGAAVGTLIVVWPFCGTTTGGYTILHRLSPACVLQVIAAGVGASWITSWLPVRLRQHWAAPFPAVMMALYLLVAHRHEIHDPNGITDEFWMLRTHLAPGGVVKKECKLVWVGRSMDTDIHNFEQILPGMEGVQCQQRDCLADVSKGGCFYYMRGLNCFHSDAPTTPECAQRGKTPSGGYLDCIDPECVRVETSLTLELVEQRTVDVHSVWNYEHGHPTDPHYPIEADVGLYRVVDVRR